MFDDTTDMLEHPSYITALPERILRYFMHAIAPSSCCMLHGLLERWGFAPQYVSHRLLHLPELRGGDAANDQWISGKDSCIHPLRGC